ncbi:hypothetical protein DPMN_038780 [Dreissena polymorpha]|uniref:THAP-type domain-containing protein n=1 Tax=Dreissena polymorpha TaxID=45954 RepID=A0A9D4MFA8_DREPO|nr:hypothetical protein DPMN_038780 [Dreissena polymorpha]
MPECNMMNDFRDLCYVKVKLDSTEFKAFVSTSQYQTYSVASVLGLRLCAAFGCNARPAKGKKGFFRFTKDKSIRRKCILAVNSRRIIDGKVVDFTPSKHTKLCIKHFEDKCFVHPPSVMASAGFGLRLLLLPDAVPTLFPDTDNCKALQPRALKPDE